MDQFLSEQVGKLYINVVQLQDLVNRLKIELKQKQDEIAMLKANQKAVNEDGYEAKGESTK